MLSQRQLLTLKAHARARELRLALVDHDSARAAIDEHDFEDWARHTRFPQAIARWMKRIGKEAKNTEGRK